MQWHSRHQQLRENRKTWKLEYMKFCYAGITLALRRISYSLSVGLVWSLGDLPQVTDANLRHWGYCSLGEFFPLQGVTSLTIYFLKNLVDCCPLLLGQCWARNSTENSLLELVHQPALFMSCCIRFFPPPLSFNSCCIEALKFGWQSHTVNLAPKLSLYDSVSLFLPCTIG